MIRQKDLYKIICTAKHIATEEKRKLVETGIEAYREYQKRIKQERNKVIAEQDDVSIRDLHQLIMKDYEKREHERYEYQLQKLNDVVPGVRAYILHTFAMQEYYKSQNYQGGDFYEC